MLRKANILSICVNIFSIVFLLFIYFCKCKDSLVHVETALGEIIGTKSGDKGVKQFLGIPFAKPPIGRLRFAGPEPVEPFSKPYYALQWPSQCVQKVDSFLNVRWNMFNLNNRTTEDCLYLNVWTPTVERNASLPVLVWIHGGGMFSGSSSFQPYDSTWLAGEINAVVVTINYRIGILGYLYSETVPDSPGNQGLRDQIEALKWIQRNIHYFGGNPAQVTLWGQSAGSWSVSAHILMPESRSLFRNAIMMSGAALTLNAIATPQFYYDSLAPGLRQANCSLGDGNSVVSETVECLRQLDAGVVDDILYGLPITAHSKMPLFVIDGTLIPRRPKDLFLSGHFKTDINLLVSTVEDEGSFILNSLGGQFAIDNPTPITAQESRAYLQKYSENVFPARHYPKKLVDYFYFIGMNGSWTEDEQSNHVRRQTARAVGDGQLTCPTIEFGRRVAKYGSGRVYSMRYRAKGGRVKMLCSDWAQAACHCDDLYPAFGMPFRYPADYNDREREISREYSRIFSQFIRTGKPRNDKEWPPSTISKQDVISPVYEIRDEFSRRPENYVINADSDKCQSVWNKFLSS